jgi:hypothetical protein
MTWFNGCLIEYCKVFGSEMRLMISAVADRQLAEQSLPEWKQLDAKHQ